MPASKPKCALWVLLVQCSALLIGMSVLASVAGFYGVTMLGYSLGIPLASYASRVPIVVLPAVWIVGIITVWRKHYSKTLVVLLILVGMVGFWLAPVVIYVGMMLYMGSMRSR